MALAIDPSTPAMVVQTGLSATVTTASFTPPVGALLLACGWGTLTQTGVTLSMSDTDGDFWTKIQERNSADAGGQSGVASLFWARAVGDAITCTCTSSYFAPALQVYVITGADATTPIGGTTEGSSTSTSLTTGGFTIQRAGSLGFVCGENTTGAVMTSSDTTNVHGTNSGHFGIAGYKSLGAAGGSATFNLGSSGSPKINWVSCEVMAALPASSNPSAWRRRRSGLYVR